MDQDLKVLSEYVEDLYHAKDELGLNSWEQEFIDTMERYRKSGWVNDLTANQRHKILQLAEKYEL